MSKIVSTKTVNYCTVFLLTEISFTLAEFGHLFYLYGRYIVWDN